MTQYCDDTWVEIVEMYHLVLFFNYVIIIKSYFTFNCPKYFIQSFIYHQKYLTDFNQITIIIIIIIIKRLLKKALISIVAAILILY